MGPARYFLTFCTLHRRRSFEHAGTADSARLQILRTASDESFAVLAYCLMPDHAHLLIEGLTDQADMLRFVKLAKQRSGALHATENGGRLWQKGYYERVLREEDDLQAIARYILAHPVRAGLVTTPLDYPYLGSERWTVKELLESV